MNKIDIQHNKKPLLWRSLSVLALTCGLATYSHANTETFTLKSDVTYGEEGVFFNTNKGKVALNLYTLPEKVTNSLHKYNLNKGGCIQVVSSQGFLHENGGGGSGIQSISNCTAGTAAKTATISSVPSTSRFKIFNQPNVVSLGRCYMEECSWSKSISTRVIQQTANETVLKVTLLGGSSKNTDDSDSISHAKPAKISWAKTPHELTLHCSYQRPSVALGNQVDRLPLNANSTPDYLESSVNLYFKYCHSDMTSKDPIRKYGYNVPDIQE